MTSKRQMIPERKVLDAKKHKIPSTLSSSAMFETKKPENPKNPKKNKPKNRKSSSLQYSKVTSACSPSPRSLQHPSPSDSGTFSMGSSPANSVASDTKLECRVPSVKEVEIPLEAITSTNSTPTDPRKGPLSSSKASSNTRTQYVPSPTDSSSLKSSPPRIPYFLVTDLKVPAFAHFPETKQELYRYKFQLQCDNQTQLYKSRLSSDPLFSAAILDSSKIQQSKRALTLPEQKTSSKRKSDENPDTLVPPVKKTVFNHHQEAVKTSTSTG